jgi:hypothetical protein
VASADSASSAEATAPRPATGGAIDLRACVALASPQWKATGLTLDLKWDGKVLTLNKCTPIDLSATSGSLAEGCGTLTGKFPDGAGWEVLGAKEAPLCRHATTTQLGDHSVTCMYYPPPTPRSRGEAMPPMAPGVTTGGVLTAIPLLPGATEIVVYDQACRGDPTDVFSIRPLARFMLR